MKSKIIYLAILVLLNTSLFAQNETDALRYSNVMNAGTARFMGMSGAFGAIGGDMSVLSTNPAGIAIYKRSDFAFTPILNFNSTESNFAGTKKLDNSYSLNFSNIGLVGTFGDESSSDWKNVNFGFSYQLLSSLNQNTTIEGVNTKGSMIDNWVNNFNDGIKSDLYEWLAYDAYLVDYDSIRKEYWSPLSDDAKYGQTQRKNINNSGRIGEYAFSFGANYNDLLYLGGTLGLQKIRYNSDTKYSESNIPYSSYTINQPNSSYILDSPDDFTFEEHLEARGSGVNIKFGMILRPVDFIRIGATIHSPTLISMSEKFNTEVVANYKYQLPNGKYVGQANSKTNEFDYEITTPLKMAGSLGITIQKFALLGIEYEYINYTMMRMSASDNYNFDRENEAIKNVYRATSNIKAGAEFLLGNFVVRGGAAYYGNPYSSETKMTDGSKLSFSGGLGINTGTFYMDMALVHSQYKSTHFLYNGYVDEPVPELKSSTNQFVLTFGVRF